MTYEASSYWERVLGDALDERGVAYPWLPLTFNQAMYRSELRATRRLLADHGISPAARVLDIGAGSGIWVDFWDEVGATEVVGVDLTEAAVTGLRERYPDKSFVQADIGADQPPAQGPFDVVSAMSVLLHITDDTRWRQAWKNIADVLAPGGFAILIEPLVAHTWWGKPFDEHSNSKARAAADYEGACQAAGLKIVDIRPATVLLSNPIDARTRVTWKALTTGWAALEASVRGSEARGRIIGGALERVDQVAMRALPYGPTAKLILARRS